VVFEQEVELLKSHGHATLLTSHASITLPFALACLLSLYLYPRLSDNSVSFTSFSLFMGAAMSITAFPVLARILSERNMLQGRLGTVAIACAAVGLVGSLVVSHLMAGLLYGVRPTDPVTFSSVALLLLGVALLACYIPARRAIRVDTLVALRHE